MVKAVEYGILDCNFSPWIHYKGKVLIVRDKAGALRYLDHGNLPLPKEVIEYHREKIAEREKAENKKADLEMMIRDVYRISNVYMKAS
jgi:methylaspartate mutase epsilon subunit